MNPFGYFREIVRQRRLIFGARCRLSQSFPDFHGHVEVVTSGFAGVFCNNGKRGPARLCIDRAERPVEAFQRGIHEQPDRSQWVMRWDEILQLHRCQQGSPASHPLPEIMNTISMTPVPQIFYTGPKFNRLALTESRDGSRSPSSGSARNFQFLFAGFDSERERTPAIYLLIGTDKLKGINPHAYVVLVLTHLANHKINRIDELLPSRVADKLCNRLARLLQIRDATNPDRSCP
jgi:IS66 C-terminal element